MRDSPRGWGWGENGGERGLGGRGPGGRGSADRHREEVSLGGSKKRGLTFASRVIRTPGLLAPPPPPQQSHLAFHLLAALPLHQGLPEQSVTQAFSQRAVLRRSPG